MIGKPVIAIMLLMTAACTSSSAGLRPLPAPVPGAYRLGPGDEIRVNVFGLDAATNTYVVGDAGTISVPLLAPLMASGRTADELQAALVAAIRKRDLMGAPSVSVQIQKYRPFFILGEVQKPGQYSFVPGMSVLTAVSIAGGFTYRADTRKVAISRPTTAGAVRGTAGPDTLVQPGDTVNILEAWF